MKKIYLFTILFIIQSFNGFGQCFGGQYFDNQEALDNFNPDCQFFDSSITIVGDDITNINSLSGLTYIFGLAINAPNLTDLSPLNGLVGCRDLSLVLSSGQGIFPNLENVENSLAMNISGNWLTGFENLQHIGSIDVFTSAVVIDAFNAVISINVPQELGGNGMLGFSASQASSANIFNSLESVQGLCKIYNSGTMPTLVSLGSVGSLEIHNNLSNFENINALLNLNQCGGIDIAGNTGLTDIQAISGITNLQNGTLSVKDNNLLSNLSGLQFINPQTIGNLVLFNNPSLAVCNFPFICEYLSTSEPVYNIFGNANGCGNYNQIIESCSTMNVSNFENQTIKLYPNPTSSILNIQDRKSVV